MATPIRVDQDGQHRGRGIRTGHGLGSRLMEKIIRYCRQRGVRCISGDVLASNSRMLQLAETHGFRTEPVREGVVRVVLELGKAA